MGRKKLDLTPEEVEQRKEKVRQQKAEYARRKRAEKSETNSVVGDSVSDIGFTLNLNPSASPMLNTLQQSTDNTQSKIEIPIEKPKKSPLQQFDGIKMTAIDTAALNDQVKKFKEDYKRRAQGLPPNPESGGLIDKLKNLLPNVRSMLSGVPVPSLSPLQTEAEERKQLINEYITLAEQMPGQDITIPDNVRKSIKELEKCDIQELRLRLIYARKHIFTGIDSDISKQVLHIACMGVGKFLNCYDELEKEVKEDKYLQGVTQNLLTSNLLSMISDPLKVAGLFGNHVIKARMQAAGKHKDEIVQPTPIVEKNEAPVVQTPAYQPPSQLSASIPLFTPPPGVVWKK